MNVIGLFDQAKDLPEAVKDYIRTINKKLDLIKQLAGQLDNTRPTPFFEFFESALNQLSE